MNANASIAKLRTLAVRRHALTSARLTVAPMDDAERADAINDSAARLTRDLQHLDRLESRWSINRPDVLTFDPVHSSLPIQDRLILDARHIF